MLGILVIRNTQLLRRSLKESHLHWGCAVSIENEIKKSRVWRWVELSRCGNWPPVSLMYHLLALQGQSRLFYLSKLQSGDVSKKKKYRDRNREIETQVRKFNNFSTSASFLSREGKLGFLLYKASQADWDGKYELAVSSSVSWHVRSFHVLGPCSFIHRRVRRMSNRTAVLLWPELIFFIRIKATTRICIRKYQTSLSGRPLYLFDT